MPEFLTQFAWWRHVGGAGWCMLMMLPFYFVAGFSHLDATRFARDGGVMVVDATSPVGRVHTSQGGVGALYVNSPSCFIADCTEDRAPTRSAYVVKFLNSEMSMFSRRVQKAITKR